MISTRQFNTKNALSSQPQKRKPTTMTVKPIRSAIAHFMADGISFSPRIRSRSLLGSCHDGREGLCVQAGSADQRTVELFLRHQSRNVVRLDAAAVENPHLGGGFGGKLVPHAAAQEAVSRRG